MTPPLQITSLQNPRIKNTSKLLSDKSVRFSTGLFAIEGAREIERAFASGYEPVQCFVAPSLLSTEARHLLSRLSDRNSVEMMEVSTDAFQKLVMREDKDGLLVTWKQKPHTLATLTEHINPLILAIHGIEKPGNLGALLRSADGAGVSSVMVLGETVDLYNPHVIRGSLGTIFALNIALCSQEAFQAYCTQRKIQIIAAALSDGAKPHHSIDLTSASAILLGSEAQGLPSQWLSWAHHVAKIPMAGIADSLNVSAAGAIILYEAVRQRALVRP